MTLTREENIFLIIFIVNLAVSILYLIYGIIFAATARSVKKDKNAKPFQDNRRTYLLRFCVMVFCPLIGPLFFFISHLFYLTFFRFSVNLEDVSFSKERVETQVKANEEQERNIIPVEEALAINDKKSLRTAMMSIIRGETKGSLSSIAMALDADDSETAHYAASILSDKLNEFRMNVRKMYADFLNHHDNTECGENLIDYMNEYLEQKIFTQLEQNGFVRMMEETANTLYEKDASILTAQRYENICLRLLEIEEFEKTEKWCQRLAGHYPEELCTYTCRLKLYFTTKDRNAFFQTLNALKETEIVIDNETLEMLRIFS